MFVMKRKKSESWPGQARGQDAPFLSHCPGPEQNGGDPEEMCPSDLLSCHLCTWHGGGLSWMLNGCWRVRVQAPTPCVSPRHKPSTSAPGKAFMEQSKVAQSPWFWQAAIRAQGAGGGQEQRPEEDQSDKQEPVPPPHSPRPPQARGPCSSCLPHQLSFPTQRLLVTQSPGASVLPPAFLSPSVTNVRLLCAH